MAKSKNFIVKYPNDNTTYWDMNEVTKKHEKLFEKPHFVTLKFFRYMANVPVDVFKQLQKHFSY